MFRWDRFGFNGALAFVVCAVFFTPWLRCQSSYEGSLNGRIADSSGAVVAGAQVAVSSGDNGTSRTSASVGDGSFVFAHLPSGIYTVTIRAAGYAAYRNASVVIAVGRAVHLDVQLVPAQATEQVTVQAQIDTLDTTQPSPVTNIDRDRIEELPIPSRNYLNFTLLVPSLAAANAAQQRQAPGTGEGGFSAGGLRPGSNALFLDGAEDNDEFTGLSRTELSPEAISDFQVIDHGYEAQSGGSAGGSVDVESRSGAKLQHGDAFLFVQNGALNGTPALEVVPRKPDENLLRAGFSTGGRFGPASLFYHVAGEQEMARGEEAGDFSPQQAAQIDAALAQAGPLRGFHVQQGFFPTIDQETEFSVRADRALGRNDLMLRYALTNHRAVNDAFHRDELADLSARGSAFYDDNSLNGSWSTTISPHLFNRIDFEAAQRRVALRTGSVSGPGVIVAGVAEIGTPYEGNGRRFETPRDASAGLMLERGRHRIGAGVSTDRIALRAAQRDGFAGLYVFPDLNALATGNADFYTQAFGDPNTNFTELRSAAYVQDHWTAKRYLAVDLGLRYEDNHLPSSLPNNAMNFSPRVGFAWSPNKAWVVRGGFGTFFDRYLMGTINRIVEFDGVRAEQQIAEGPAATALYRAGATYTAPLSGIAPSIWQAAPGWKNPYAETASLGVERALPAQWSLSAEYRHVQGVHMGRTENTNLPPPVVLTAGNATVLGIPSPSPQQVGRLVFPEERIDSRYDAVNRFQTEASSKYDGMTLSVNRQFTDEFELMAGYTFSKTIDDASYDTEQPQNPYAPGSERAASLEDQRHRFVLSGLWVLGPDLDDPADVAKASKPNAVERVLYGLEFAPILEAGSGFPDDPLTGLDSNREHVYLFEARPLGYARNQLRTPGNVDLDLRVLKMVPAWRGHLDIVAESFNLLNRQNVNLLNPAYGSQLAPAPGFARRIEETDPRRIQFSLDYEY